MSYLIAFALLFSSRATWINHCVKAVASAAVLESYRSNVAHAKGYPWSINLRDITKLIRQNPIQGL